MCAHVNVCTLPNLLSEEHSTRVPRSSFNLRSAICPVMACHFSFIAHNIQNGGSDGNRRGLRVLILSKAPIKVKNIGERKDREGWGGFREKKRNGGTDEKPNMRHSQKRRPLVMCGTFEEEKKKECV